MPRIVPMSHQCLKPLNTALHLAKLLKPEIKVEIGPRSRENYTETLQILLRTFRQVADFVKSIHETLNNHFKINYFSLSNFEPQRFFLLGPQNIKSFNLMLYRPRALNFCQY